jgi:hypothetical protein
LGGPALPTPQGTVAGDDLPADPGSPLTSATRSGASEAKPRRKDDAPSSTAADPASNGPSQAQAAAPVVAIAAMAQPATPTLVSPPTPPPPQSGSGGHNAPLPAGAGLADAPGPIGTAGDPATGQAAAPAPAAAGVPVPAAADEASGVSQSPPQTGAAPALVPAMASAATAVATAMASPAPAFAPLPVTAPWPVVTPAVLGVRDTVRAGSAIGAASTPAPQPGVPASDAPRAGSDRPALTADGSAGPGAGSAQSGQGFGSARRDGQPGDAQAVATVASATLETHAPPVPALSPVQQIASSIVDAASRAADAEGASPPAPLTQQPARPGSPPLQLLDIKLEPPDLGEVSVRMRLSGSKLDLHIEVSQKDTAPLLGKDGDALASQLQSSGYTVDTLTIKAAEGGSAAQQQQHQQNPSQGQQTQGQQSAFQSSTPSNDGGSGAGGAARQDRSPSGAGGSDRQSNGNETRQDGTAQARLSGDLFV